MHIGKKRVLVCSCEATMPVDGKALARGCQADEATQPFTQLCRAQLEHFRRTLGDEDALLVGCTQEAPLFAETAEDAGFEGALSFVNLRERAGWSEQGGKAGAKMAALLAEAALDIAPAQSVALKSDGNCLIYGHDERALEAADQLKDRLSVTVLLDRPGELMPPRRNDVAVFKGTIRSLSGHLGAFDIEISDHAPMVVSSRQTLAFEPGRHARTVCDLVLDLSGGQPLVTAPDKRDGYVHVDPDHPAAVQRALFDLADLVGDFDKPRYVDFHTELCAHSRSKRTGCTRCLEVCPAGAITPAGDTVAIDPYVCGGCGGCASVCPTGAADYALPRIDDLFRRLRTLLSTYRDAAGSGARAPALLVHDDNFGGEAIDMMARFGRGLPAHVLPFALNEVTQIGLETLAAGIAYGAGQIVLLVPPKRRAEADGLRAQVALADDILGALGYGAGRIVLCEDDDPDQIENRLWALEDPLGAAAASFLPLGDKRNLMRMALEALNQSAPTPVDILPLDQQAPFGRIVVDDQGCTLCLACVSQCPADALRANDDKPQLRFIEDACVQCGLCAASCPEKVIQLEPRLNFTEQARSAVVLKEEEPYACIRCGKPFGVKSSVERIVAKLADKHWMFQDSSAIDRIRMCDDCRVKSQFELPEMAQSGRPVTRTTEDYLRERSEMERLRAQEKAKRED